MDAVGRSEVIDQGPIDDWNGCAENFDGEARQ